MAALKIGILTFHRCINYGSYWQAKNLAEGLQARGYNATILDHNSKKVNIAEWKCAYQPTLPAPTLQSDWPLYRKKVKGFFKAFSSLPLSHPFPLEQPTEMGDYDVVIVGSDEVWNLLHPWYGKCPPFYGEGLQAQRLISYAASFGNYPASWPLDQDWANKLLSFDRISVRDELAQALVRNSTGIEAELVLDPCLVFDVKPNTPQDKHFEGPYVAVYGHSFSEEFITSVQRYAKRKRIRTISIGYRNDWANEQWIDADPNDFFHFMTGSSCVATNFFHGCVFALKDRKPFVCETSPYRSNKIRSLMDIVGSGRHLADAGTDDTNIAELLSKPLDRNILDKIEGLRKSSRNYLSESLKENRFDHELRA
jgi:hypothetical protein